MQLVNIGFGNMISAERMIAIVSPESAPIKRIVQDSRERGALIDATCGRKNRAPSSSWTVTMWCFPLCSWRPLQTALTPAKNAEDPVEAEAPNV